MSENHGENSDQMRRFMFEEFAVRGAMVKLDETWREVASRHAYGPSTRTILAEALAASALFISHLKMQGRISLQLASKGPISQLYAECDSEGRLRALARCPDNAPGHFRFDALADGGQMVITLEPDQGRNRYQGIVSLQAKVLAKALEDYFQQSEQLETRIWLFADDQSVAGLMLQRMPSDRADEDSDGWNRVTQIADTLTPNELLHLSAQEVLHRLYHEEKVRLFEPKSLAFHCRCSRERMVDVLRMLGADEARAALNENGELISTCEFCNQEYRFDKIDIEQLFLADGETGHSGQTH
jgi:molecular chaperone Hsp33